MEKLYQSAKTRPGADCGSDHELLIAKFRLKSKKIRKTTRPFRHDLNQIPYNYAVEVRNRFKGLELIECLENLGRCSGHCTGEKDQDHTPTKKCEKAKKWLSQEALQIAVKSSKKQRRTGKINPFECRVPKDSKE